MQFVRSQRRSDAYLLHYEGYVFGSVRKVAQWTVRGDRIVWEAHRKGVYIGSAKTRKAAAQLLLDHINGGK